MNEIVLEANFTLKSESAYKVWNLMMNKTQTFINGHPMTFIPVNLSDVQIDTQQNNGW